MKRSIRLLSSLTIISGLIACADDGQTNRSNSSNTARGTQTAESESESEVDYTTLDGTFAVSSQVVAQIDGAKIKGTIPNLKSKSSLVLRFNGDRASEITVTSTNFSFTGKTLNALAPGQNVITISQYPAAQACTAQNIPVSQDSKGNFLPVKIDCTKVIEIGGVRAKGTVEGLPPGSSLKLGLNGAFVSSLKRGLNGAFVSTVEGVDADIVVNGDARNISVPFDFADRTIYAPQGGNNRLRIVQQPTDAFCSIKPYRSGYTPTDRCKCYGHTNTTAPNSFLDLAFNLESLTCNCKSLVPAEFKPRNPASVSIRCHTRYKLGGTITNLYGSTTIKATGDFGIVSVPVSGNGDGTSQFTFPEGVPAGSVYSLGIQSKGQLCKDDHLPKVMPDRDDDSIAVNCENPMLAMAGRATAVKSNDKDVLSGSVQFEPLIVSNGVDDVTIKVLRTPNGISSNFTFPTKVQFGETFTISIKQQPLGQTCKVTTPNPLVFRGDGNVEIVCEQQMVQVRGQLTVTGEFRAEKISMLLNGLTFEVSESDLSEGGVYDFVALVPFGYRGSPTVRAYYTGNQYRTQVCSVNGLRVPPTLTFNYEVTDVSFTCDRL